MSDKLALRRIIEIAARALEEEASEDGGEEMEPEEREVASTARTIKAERDAE